MAKKLTIPAHLRPETAKWMRGILAEFDLESRDYWLLIKTAEAWDRSEQARELIAQDGLTVVDRYGTPKAHPAVAIERDSRTAFVRGLRELALDLEDPAESRPPRGRGYAQT